MPLTFAAAQAKMAEKLAQIERNCANFSDIKDKARLVYL